MQSKQTKGKNLGFESIDTLMSRWKDGTFGEIIDDWKWIFSYSRKYIKSIILYTVLGLLSSTMGVASSVASKYVIDIIREGWKNDDDRLQRIILG